MKTIFFCILFFTFISFPSSAQNDSISFVHQQKKIFIRKQILPVSLIAAGSLLNVGEIKNKIQKKLPDTDNNIDDYIQYAPMAEMYLLDAIGFKHQNGIFDQTKYLALSQLSSSLIVHFLKNTTNVQRPNGGNHSFSSGHTTTAFVGATVLFYEFGETEPMLAYSGFIFATATGVLRMTNNEHWLPDVIVGEGIGILTTNLIYYFKPFQGFQPFSKKKDVVFTPIINANTLGFQCRF